MWDYMSINEQPILNSQLLSVFIYALTFHAIIIPIPGTGYMQKYFHERTRPVFIS
jgi:hypothetical protein